MSFAVDVNILLYATDAGSPKYERAGAFIKECALGREVFCLAWVTVMSYLRIATHPAIFNRPLTHQEAEKNVEMLIALPHFRLIGEEEGFWETYRDVTRDVPAKGNLVPDAHLAALLAQHGIVTLYTHDRDFRKFPFLDVRDPLEE
ncbi:MAG: TA system VapC family ribonuclease toxin [Burkholderiales bacterium]